jgi:plasmid stabilization system protein ParE
MGEIIWAPRALKQFNDAIKFIRKDSDQNADKIKEKILSEIDKLASTKAVHRKDVYKKNNDGHFHYFEIVKYRISYYDNGKDIFIIRVRHTSMKQLYY